MVTYDVFSITLDLKEITMKAEICSVDRKANRNGGIKQCYNNYVLIINY